MVKITNEMLLKHASHTKKRTHETEQQFYKRLTHVYLQERNIEEIDNLSMCKNLSVLYLYDNCISSIKNLSFAVHLTHLYLQKNKINRISGMKYLPRLTKLYLGHNSITVVEGLEENECLTELHIENQVLPPGEKLLFDPITMETLAKSLNVLNVSTNGLEDTSDLKILRRLNHLNIEDNELTDIVDFSNSLMNWPSLFNLNVQGNPFCEQKKFRDKLIIMSKSLVSIDDKEVSEATRQFLQKWYEKKREAKQQRRNSKQHASSFDTINDKTQLQFHYPTSQDSLYRLDDPSKSYTLAYPVSSKHISKHHRQFVEVLAKAKALPPLDQMKPRYTDAFQHYNDAPSRVMNENKPAV